ncbi:MAG: DUF58 domain-containing protein [Bacteroidia bacterium]|nr:DUF58 domain-containing protein [Bacteroidia bacterium]
MKDLFVHVRLFLVLGGLICLFMTAYLLPGMLPLAYMALAVFFVAVGLDTFLLFQQKKAGLQALRVLPDRFSNGDMNPVHIHIKSYYRFPLLVEVIDEVPHQFQWRDMKKRVRIGAGGEANMSYELRPVTRGEYEFGRLILLARSPIGMIILRNRYELATNIAVYPSYLQMQKYQLLAVSNRLTELGVKPIRRLGHTTEFEQIKEYVRGDDYRTINWKATARSSKLMVNQYMDERSQQIYCLIDKSRTMKMPFEGMSLLDYAINASLVLANIAMYKHDRSGLVTFANGIDHFLPASNQPRHMRNFQELLYRQETDFQESDYERLYAHISRRISHRSLLVLFTNFESQSAMRRQLPFLQRIAKQHLLIVVLFENTELKELLSTQPANTEEIYIKAVGEQFALDKKLIVKELAQYGIQSILTPPQNLTVNTINKYLEIKARALI